MDLTTLTHDELQAHIKAGFDEAHRRVDADENVPPLVVWLLKKAHQLISQAERLLHAAGFLEDTTAQRSGGVGEKD